ncbi:hypothetical protein CALCODRAFT_479377 [Calocera cornea HHB12733]|uniref:Uncharacterized protein n=1 Tax=Calocera cornea HHB12733 TaxID=1353952 RepID=A0A165JRS6_9BASI|nr:hypothetical protein CALCODRAFT_479377 [Calocera cornea HHB12733]
MENSSTDSSPDALALARTLTPTPTPTVTPANAARRMPLPRALPLVCASLVLSHLALNDYRMTDPTNLWSMAFPSAGARNALGAVSIGSAVTRNGQKTESTTESTETVTNDPSISP